jgi:hypothetical protein
MNLQADAAGGRPAAASQLPLFPDQSRLLGELERLQLEELSPLEALNLLYEWQSRFNRR